MEEKKPEEKLEEKKLEDEKSIKIKKSNKTRNKSV